MSSAFQRRASRAMPSSSVSRSSTAPGPSAGTRPAVSSEKPGEQGAADGVDGGEHRRARAEVPEQRQHVAIGVLARRLALAAKDLEVRVAEAVDRLVLVADHEHPGLGAAQHLDQPELDPVGVLELVDHDLVEALAPDPGERRRCAQEVERAQLEVGEVERRALLLEPLVARVHALEQAFERRPGVDCGSGLGRAQRLRLAPGLRRLDRLADLGETGLGHALAAQPLVRRDRHRGEPPRLIGRRGTSDLVVAGRQQALERVAEGPVAKPSCLIRVEHAERGVEPRRQRVGGEQPPAEGVDRHHPSALGRPREPQQLVGGVGIPLPAGLARAPRELAADPRAHLGRGALGEGEGQQSVDRDPIIGDRGAVPVDEHRGLAGSRARLEEGVAPPCRDRGRLLGRRLGTRARDRHRGRGALGLEVRERQLCLAHGSSLPLAGSSPTSPSARSSRQIG